MSTLFQGGSEATTWSSLEEVRTHRGWFIALGIGLMLLGILAIAVPFAATLATTLFLGWLLIVGGIAHAIHAFQNRRWTGFPWASRTVTVTSFTCVGARVSESGASVSVAAPEGFTGTGP